MRNEKSQAYKSYPELDAIYAGGILAARARRLLIIQPTALFPSIIEMG
jgi:hypothetical protein